MSVQFKSYLHQRCDRICGNKKDCFAKNKVTKEKITAILNEARPVKTIMSHISKQDASIYAGNLIDLAVKSLEEILYFRDHLEEIALEAAPVSKDIAKKQHKVCLNDFVINRAWPVQEFTRKIPGEIRSEGLGELLSQADKSLENLIENIKVVFLNPSEIPNIEVVMF